MELGRLYRKGVDLNQLPEVIAELVRTYDQDHSPGQSFSQFWRGRLAEGHKPSPLDPDEYRPDVWLCEICRHEHTGDDPPIFCPKCASLRRNFVRISDGDPTADAAVGGSSPAGSSAEGTDSYRALATLAEPERDGRSAVNVDGRELALFLVGSEVRCLDGLCPHEGGPMAQGELVAGVVTCPWHGWAFHCDSGRAADGNGCALKSYPVKIEDGRILVAVPATSIRTQEPALSPLASVATPASAAPADDSAVTLRVIEVIDETPDVKTIKLDNSPRLVAVHRPGQHVKVCVTGPAGPTWRTFTLSSPPTRLDVLEITVKRNPAGVVSPAIHSLDAGSELTIKGPSGTFVFDTDLHKEPIVLAVAGSGVTPAMSILRTVHDLQLDLPVTLLYGCRSRSDVIFARELDMLRLRLANFRMILTLSQPEATWNGSVGRVGPGLLARHVPEPARGRYFLCGPGGFTEILRAWLAERGVPRERIHSEQFGKPRGTAPPDPLSAWESQSRNEAVVGVLGR